MAKFDARPPSFITEPRASRSNGLVLLSGGDRNAALSERVVKNHAAFARRHGYAHWWHRGSMVAESGWLLTCCERSTLAPALNTACLAQLT